ncbi:MAG: HEAT repeat domain-containing protein [Verrucomicrobia bacterium]|nr:HEAT repeat domain-containing protein [Verrucomicrobiota bacterium]
MSASIRPFHSFGLAFASAALLLAGCETVSPPAPSAADAPAAKAAAAMLPSSPVSPVSVALHELDYSGDQSALIALDADIVAAGKDPKKIAALEKRLVDLLKRPDGSVAARQVACERLGFILGVNAAPSPATLKLLGAMLKEPAESELARLALAPIPGPEVDALFVDALTATKGKTRLGVIESLAVRRPTSAIAALRPLLADADGRTAALAATTLGQIGTAEALAALGDARPATTTVLEARTQVARSLPTGASTLAELAKDPALSSPRRAAALRAQLDFDPAAAPARIAEVLSGNDWTLKESALESLATSKAPGLVTTLAGKLSSWDAPTRTAVVAAFGRRGEAAAVPAVVTSIKSSDSTVRAAAIEALGFLPGTAEHVALLARLAASEKTSEAKLAKAALARLNGPGVSAAVLAGAESGDAAARVVFIEQLAQRNLTEGLALLRKSRDDASVAVRTAAVTAFGDLAPTIEQAFVLDWAATAKDSAEQTRALRALVSLTLRDPDTVKRAQPIFARIEQSSPAVATQLLPVLPRLGGADSAACAARLALNADAKLAEAAASTLSRWTDRTAQASLLTVATKATVAPARASALQAALRNFERNREPWTVELTKQVAQLLGATTDTALRERLVVLLNRAADKDAESLAQKLAAEPALANAARDAAACIAANLAGPPTARVSASEGSAKNLFDGRTSSQWRVPATPDQWVELDFKQARPLHRLTLDQTNRTGDFPEKYEVFVTDDPAKPGKAIVTGAGQRNRTAIDFPAATKGRYVIVKHTAERADGTWSICEVFVD